MKSEKHTRMLLYWMFITSVTLAIISFVALVVMLLWNIVMPGIIICNTINFWQSLGLIALVALLVMDKSKLYGWLYE